MLPLDLMIVLAIWLPVAGVVLALCIGPEGEEPVGRRLVQENDETALSDPDSLGSGSF